MGWERNGDDFVCVPCVALKTFPTTRDGSWGAVMPAGLHDVTEVTTVCHMIGGARLGARDAQPLWAWPEGT